MIKFNQQFDVYEKLVDHTQHYECTINNSDEKTLVSLKKPVRKIEVYSNKPIKNVKII